MRSTYNSKLNWALIKREWDNSTEQEKAHRSLVAVKRRSAAQHLRDGAKPVVVVLRAQGKPLLVLRVGDWFVAAFTWDKLMYKTAYGTWKRVAETTLRYRLP